MRPGWDAYFLGIAGAVAERSDCIRAKIGAVIVGEDHRIIECGYPGVPSGQPGCLEGACPRGRHYERNLISGTTGLVTVRCGCGSPWPCPDYAEPGAGYDEGPGACISVHAEANALLLAGRRAWGAVLYCTREPCRGCAKLIQGARIARVVTPERMRDGDRA